MNLFYSFGRAVVASVILIGAYATNDFVSAQQALPKTIRLAGPGNAEGKPFGSGTLGVLKVKSYLEDEFKKDGISQSIGNSRAVLVLQSMRLLPTASLILPVMAVFPISLAVARDCERESSQDMAYRQLISSPAKVRGSTTSRT
jgi:hypothetical protein